MLWKRNKDSGHVSSERIKEIIESPPAEGLPVSLEFARRVAEHEKEYKRQQKEKAKTEALTPELL